MHTPRPVRTGCVAAAACALLLHAACRSPSLAATYKLDAPFFAVDGSDASGRFEVFLSAAARQAYAEIARLAPDAAYVLAYDGVPVATIETDATGIGWSGHEVSSPAQDPRGRRVAILDDGGYEVLVLAEPSHPAHVQSDLVPLTSFAPGQAYAHLRLAGAAATLRVSLQGVPIGHYDVVANGDARGAIDVTGAAGLGDVTVDATGLDPENAAIEVQQDGVGLYVGGIAASVYGLDWCTPGGASQAFAPTGEGSALASLQTQQDCGRRFTVEVAGVPMGDYEVRVAGVARGTIYVGMDENDATSGSIAFANGERGSARLDFDPVGQPVEIVAEDGLRFAIGAFRP